MFANLGKLFSLKSKSPASEPEVAKASEQPATSEAAVPFTACSKCLTAGNRTQAHVSLCQSCDILELTPELDLEESSRPPERVSNYLPSPRSLQSASTASTSSPPHDKSVRCANCEKWVDGRTSRDRCNGCYGWLYKKGCDKPLSAIDDSTYARGLPFHTKSSTAASIPAQSAEDHSVPDQAAVQFNSSSHDAQPRTLIVRLPMPKSISDEGESAEERCINCRKVVLGRRAKGRCNGCYHWMHRKGHDKPLSMIAEDPPFAKGPSRHAATKKRRSTSAASTSRKRRRRSESSDSGSGASQEEGSSEDSASESESSFSESDSEEDAFEDEPTPDPDTPDCANCRKYIRPPGKLQHSYCNPCYKYKTRHDKPRPATLWSTGDYTNGKITYPKKKQTTKVVNDASTEAEEVAADSGPPSAGPICSNCSKIVYPGRPIGNCCNACYDYQKRKGVARPSSLWKTEKHSKGRARKKRKSRHGSSQKAVVVADLTGSESKVSQYDLPAEERDPAASNDLAKDAPKCKNCRRVVFPGMPCSGYCHPCYRYQLKHQTSRPDTLWSNSAYSNGKQDRRQYNQKSASKTPKSSSSSESSSEMSEADSSVEHPTCANCLKQVYPGRPRGKDCSACYFYQRRNDVPRPSSLWSTSQYSAGRVSATQEGGKTKKRRRKKPKTMAPRSDDVGGGLEQLQATPALLPPAPTVTPDSEKEISQLGAALRRLSPCLGPAVALKLWKKGVREVDDLPLLKEDDLDDLLGVHRMLIEIEIKRLEDLKRDLMTMAFG